MVIYIIPYIISFALVFFSKNKLSKYLNFFVILGYVLFILLCYDLTKKIDFKQLFESFRVHSVDK